MDKLVRKNTMTSIFTVNPDFIEKQKNFPSLITSDPKEALTIDSSLTLVSPARTSESQKQQHF